MKGLTVALGRLGRHSLSCSLSPDTAAALTGRASFFLLFAFGPQLCSGSPGSTHPSGLGFCQEGQGSVNREAVMKPVKPNKARTSSGKPRGPERTDLGTCSQGLSLLIFK